MTGIVRYRWILCGLLAWLYMPEAWSVPSVQDVLNAAHPHGDVDLRHLIDVGRRFFDAQSMVGAAAGDLATRYLFMIFGPMAGLFTSITSSGAAPSNGLLGEVFRVFNAGVLVLLLGYAGWNTGMAVVNTAREGSIMGKKVMTAAFPFRLLTASASLAPLPNGYSAIQVFFMWVVLHGVNVANGLWNTVAHYLDQYHSILPASVVYMGADTDATQVYQRQQGLLYNHVLDQLGSMMKGQLCYQQARLDYAREQDVSRALNIDVDRRDPFGVSLDDALSSDPHAPRMHFDDEKMVVSYEHAPQCGSFHLKSVNAALLARGHHFDAAFFARQRYDLYRSIFASLDVLAKRWLRRHEQGSFPTQCQSPTVDNPTPQPCYGVASFAALANWVQEALIQYAQVSLRSAASAHGAGPSVGAGGWASAGYHIYRLTQRPHNMSLFLVHRLSNLTDAALQNQRAHDPGVLASMWRYLGRVSQANSMLARVKSSRFVHHVQETETRGCQVYALRQHFPVEDVREVQGRCYRQLSAGGTQYLGRSDQSIRHRTLVKQARDDVDQIGQLLIKSSSGATGVSLSTLAQREQAQAHRSYSFGHILACNFAATLPGLQLDDCPAVITTLPYGPLNFLIQIFQFGKMSYMTDQFNPNNNINQDIQVFIYQLSKTWRTAFFEHVHEHPLYQVQIFGWSLFHAGMNFIQSVTMDVFFHEAVTTLKFTIQYQTRTMAASLLTYVGNFVSLKVAKIVEEIFPFGPIIAEVLRWGVSCVLLIIKGIIQGLAQNLGLYYQLNMFATNMFVPFATGLAIPVMLMGLMLGFYLPFVPLLIYLVAVVGWLMAVVEGMIAAPLVALGITHPQGHDYLGRSEQAMILTFAVLIRPAGILMGFIASTLLLQAAFLMIKLLFSQAFMSTYHHLVDGLHHGEFSAIVMYIVLLGMVVMFAYMMLAVTSQCFSLTYRLPNYLVRWIGAPPEEHGEEQALAEIQQGVKQSASRVVTAGGQMADTQARQAENFRPM